VYLINANIIEAKIALAQSSLQHWLTNELFTLIWWIKIVVLVVLIWVWFKFVDKKRLHEILTYGLLVSLICLVFDSIGTSYVLWIYPIRLLPVEFSDIHDLALFPVLYTLIYQRYATWKPFIIANTILAAFLSFPGEIVATWLHYYQPITWEHIYSFPIYICIAIFCKWVVLKILANAK